ncbi:MAG TPA: ChbG/HpnK family deacetylase, partial [Chitinophagaceae bacterium]|nr:ChbG/HpnK family deacetylase [Chitinophagaceae bacterium]
TVIMKIIFHLIVTLVFVMPSYARQKPRLVVRGDDMGFSHSGNLALIKCYKEGIEKSIEVIVPSPWFPEAVKLLKENPGVDVGIHLALTSEWDNVKWRPVSDCSSLRDSNGYFYPKVFPDKAYPGMSIKENNWKIGDIEKEFRAQIELAQKLIPHISHLSAHMGCSALSPEVTALTKRLAKEYHIPVDPGVDGQLMTATPARIKPLKKKWKVLLKCWVNYSPAKLIFFLTTRVLMMKNYGPYTMQDMKMLRKTGKALLTYLPVKR